MKETPAPPSIVVGIDGSKAAVQAALWAADEAAGRDIPLRLLYAIEPDEPQQTPHDRAARRLAVAENAVRYAFTAVEAVHKRVKVEVEITQERPVTSLIRASASAAMVCVGAVGVHHFRSERVGSTAAAIALSAHCPVAIIRSHQDGPERNASLFVVDAHGSGDNGVALEAAVEEARRRNLPVRALSCGHPGAGASGDDTGSGTDGDRRMVANLDRLLGRWTRRYPDLRVESTAVHGSLLDYLAEQGRAVQMVIVSAHDRENVEQLVGPAGNAVLHDAGGTVLIVGHQYL